MTNEGIDALTDRLRRTVDDESTVIAQRCTERSRHRTVGWFFEVVLREVFLLVVAVSSVFVLVKVAGDDLAGSVVIAPFVFTVVVTALYLSRRASSMIPWVVLLGSFTMILFFLPSILLG